MSGAHPPGHAPPPPRPWLDSRELLRSLDRQYAVGLVAMLALVAGFALYRWREPARRAAAAARQLAGDVAAGRAAFALYCAGCHGDRARGGRGAPTLGARELLAAATDQQLQWIVAAGVPGSPMPAWHLDLGGPFSDQQIAQVVRYLRSLEKGAPSVPRWREGAPIADRRIAGAAPPR